MENASSPKIHQPESAAASGRTFASKPPRRYTTKQMGDAAEMLVAAELTLAGVPALKVPDMWPGYDVIAQPINRPLQRISVKSSVLRTSNFVSYYTFDSFDWLAAVIMPDGPGQRQIYIIPRDVADAQARRDREGSKTAEQRYFEPIHISKWFGHYLNNFRLEHEGTGTSVLPTDTSPEPEAGLEV